MKSQGSVEAPETSRDSTGLGVGMCRLKDEQLSVKALVTVGTIPR